MRLLLDEHLPIRLAAELPGHTVDTVSGRGWSGIKNGELLRRMSGQYDVLVTMDRSIEFQQRISTLPFGIVLVRARSNSMQDLRPLVPSILSALAAVNPGRRARRHLRALLRRARPPPVSAASNRLGLGDKIRLVPGHCDPTVNLYDWYVCICNSRVEQLCPITARGAAY